jgi:hypothetical protein
MAHLPTTVRGTLFALILLATAIPVIVWLAISPSRPLLARAGDSRLLAAAAMLLVGVLLVSRGITPVEDEPTGTDPAAHGGHSH